jgi:hypothetical protein
MTAPGATPIEGAPRQGSVGAQAGAHAGRWHPRMQLQPLAPSVNIAAAATISKVFMTSFSSTNLLRDSNPTRERGFSVPRLHFGFVYFAMKPGNSNPRLAECKSTLRFF